MKYFLTILTAFCLALAAPAGAASYTFTGLSLASPYGVNTHHWPDAANWSPLTGPPVGAPSHDVTFPTLPPSLLLGSLAKVVNDGPLVTLKDITFSAPHVYLVALSNCAPMQINGTLTQNGPHDSFLHAQSGRLHLNNPVLAGSGVGLLTVFHPESVTGPILLNGGNHEWQIAANAPCRPGGGPPALTLGQLTFSAAGTFRLRSDVDVTFGGPVTLTLGATFCVMSLSGGATINVNATPSWIVAGGTLKYGAGVSSGSGSIIVSAGGMFAAGCSVATATVGGDLTFTSTGRTEFELGPPGMVGGGANDLLNVQGVLTLGGTLVVVPQAGFGPGTYRLFNYSSTMVNNGVSISGLPAGLTGTLHTAKPGQVDLIVANADCCAGCAPPFPASLMVNVPPGYSYLVNPFCHGAANALGSIIANPPDGSTLFKFDKATQAYSDPFTYDSGFGGWVDANFDPASSTPLPPGEGFLFNNPGASAFTLTFTGCEPDCGPRCPPTNGLCLVGRTGSATIPVIWEHIFNCPPVCGSFISIFREGSFTTYTYLNTGWSPATPTWAAGTSVFVGLTNCLSCAPLPACAVAYWKAENNAQDSFSNLHGTALNGTAYVPGVSGQAWNFDGVNDYVHVPYTSPLSVANGLTLAAWVSPTANPPATAVIAGRPLGYQLNVLPGGQASFAITIGPGVFDSVSSPLPLPLNQFSFVAGTYDVATGELKLFVDCALVASKTRAAGSRALYHRPNAPFQIGGFVDPTIPFTGGFLNGRVDDVTLFGCALSQQELNARCAAGAAGWCCPEPCTNALLLVCPQDIDVPTNPGLCSAQVQYVPPTPIGGCGSNVTVTCTPPSGVFQVGVTTVTCIATNEAEQSAQCTFRVTVRDTEPPAFICPTNAILAVDCSIPALSISATDNCTPAAQLTFTQTPPANTPVSPGLHPVGINICDAAGNCFSCTVLVEVRAVPERVFSIRTGLACGVALPVGGKDPNFIAIGYEGLGLSGLGDATVMPPSELGAGWLPNNGVSQWVHATGSNYQTLGYTAYRVTFLLPCTNAVISGRFAGHQAAVLRINGVNVVGAGPTAWRSVHYTGPFVVGLNTLDIITEDFAMTGEGNSGIRAELDAVAECCGCPTFTPTACLPPPSGLTHWYPGNPDARDVTGRNPGVLESGALAAQPGHVGRAFRFDGTTGGVDLGNVPDFDFDQCSSFSIEGWFNSTGPGSGGQTVVALNYDNNGNCAVTVQAVVLVPHDAVSDVVVFIIRDAANTASTLTSPPVAKNAFHHFAAVRDATATPHQMRLYVDCQLVAQGADVTTAALARYGSDFIGRRNACNAANVFNGFIDELSFYNRPLSGYEVAQISANGSRGKCHPSCYPTLQGSLGWWAGNANAKDTSGKGRHGTMRDGADFAPGAVRQSFRFDGGNDYMHVPAHPSLNPSGPITLGAWVNPELYPGAIAVIAGKPFGFQLDLLPNGRARFAVPVSASVLLSVDTTTVLPLNQFTHLTATYGHGPTLASRRLDIYVDGVLNNTLHDAGAPVIYHPPGVPFQIGGFNHSSFIGGFFKGRIDEVRLLNGVLPALDIKAMCAAGSRGPCPGAILPILNAGQLLLEWEGGGVLERASGLGQPWQELPEATSPHAVPMDGPAGFFRIRIWETDLEDN